MTASRSSIRCWRLFERVARLAVLTDRLSVLPHVLVVVASEAAGHVEMADVAGVGPERHLHVRKDIAPIDVLHSQDGAIEVSPGGTRTLAGLSAIEVTERARDGLERCVF